MGGFMKKQIAAMILPVKIYRLITTLSHKQQRRRVEAAVALGRLGAKKALGPLLEAYPTPNPYLRECICVAIEKIGFSGKAEIDSRIIDCLLSAVVDPDPRIRKVAASALQTLHYIPNEGQAAAFYRISLQQWNECQTLGQIAIEPLLITIATNESEIYQPAIQQLENIIGVLQDVMIAQQAAIRLEKALQQEDIWKWPEKSKTILRTLGHIALQFPELALQTQVVAIALGYIDDWHYQIRQNAAQVLVDLYQKGELLDTNKQKILAQQSKIAQPHEDRYYDDTYCRREPGIGWYHVDNYEHIDRGIGVAFDPKI